MALPDGTHPYAFRASGATRLSDDGSSLIAVVRAYPEIAKAPDEEWGIGFGLMRLLRGKCRGQS